MQLNQDEPTCLELAPGIGIGFSVSQGWLLLRDYPLLILVGLTGVGKSTVTSCLSDAGINFCLLPNRRTLTDQFIIPTILKIEQEQEVYPSCRIARFYYTNRYKQLFPAGMVHVLSQLQIHSLRVRFPLIFDGLRGEDEISYATEILPKAQFVLLEAPEFVRLQRLLERNDSFDRVTKSVRVSHDIKVSLSSFADLGIPEASNIFSSEQAAEIFAQVHQGVYSVSALCDSEALPAKRDRLRILIEERRSYNPSTTRATLQKLAPERTLVIDTTSHTPEQIAQKIVQFMRTEY